jgi:hypothetical protein
VKNPAKVKWKGDEDTYSSIRASQCSFSFYAQDQTELDDMVDIAEDANSPYVMVFKGSSLYWWGYLNTDNFKWKNEYFPTEVAFEADDLLSMSQKRFFWKETHVRAYKKEVQDVNVRVWGNQYRTISRNVKMWLPNQTVFEPTVKLGASITSSSGFYNPYPVFVEAIFGCLFEYDRTPYGELYVMEHWDETDGLPPQPTRLNGLYGRVYTSVDSLLYDDYPVNEEINNITLFDIIKQLCDSLKFRIFQKMIPLGKRDLIFMAV